MEIKTGLVAATPAVSTIGERHDPEIVAKEDAAKKVECSVEGCNNPFRARGLCVTHYNQWRKENNSASMKKCSVAGCDNLSHSEGYCPSHLFAYKQYGDANLRHSVEDVSETCVFTDDHGVCGKESQGRDLCRNHYMKMYRLNRKANKTDSDSKLLAQFWKAPATNRSSRQGSTVSK